MPPRQAGRVLGWSQSSGSTKNECVAASWQGSLVVQPLRLHHPQGPLPLLPAGVAEVRVKSGEGTSLRDTSVSLRDRLSGDSCRRRGSGCQGADRHVIKQKLSRLRRRNHQPKGVSQSQKQVLDTWWRAPPLKK